MQLRKVNPKVERVISNVERIMGAGWEQAMGREPLAAKPDNPKTRLGKMHGFIALQQGRARRHMEEAKEKFAETEHLTASNGEYN